MGVSHSVAAPQGTSPLVLVLPSGHAVHVPIEVAAPSTIEKRDAHAPCVILTRLLARHEVGNFARRLATVDLTSARVTFGVGADIRPGAFRGCGVYEC